MFAKLTDVIKKSRPFAKPYKGIVVDRDDPRKLGRVKVNIPGLLEGDKDVLPWIFPENPVGLGGRADLSSFAVPELNSALLVKFPFDDIYAGFYYGYWQSESTHQGSTFNEDYPESYGTRDSQNTYFKVNKTKKFMELVHTSGASVRMNKDSSVELRSRKEIKFVSEDGRTELVFDLVTGAVNFQPKETLEFAGIETKVNSPKFTINTSTKFEEIAGGYEQEVVGGKKTNIGGSFSKTVVGDNAVSIAGNKSELVAQETEVTYGMGRDETSVLGDMMTELIAGDRNVDILLGNYKVSLLAGNYDVEIVAGNITFNTLVGNIEVGNALASMEIGLAGNVKISALTTLDLEAVAVASLKGVITKLGNGIAPVITVLTDPLEDLITGKPKIGVPTVLAG